MLLYQNSKFKRAAAPIAITSSEEERKQYARWKNRLRPRSVFSIGLLQHNFEIEDRERLLTPQDNRSKTNIWYVLDAATRVRHLHKVADTRAALPLPGVMYAPTTRSRPCAARAPSHQPNLASTHAPYRCLPIPATQRLHAHHNKTKAKATMRRGGAAGFNSYW